MQKGEPMSDLIDRQAAIEIIQSMYPGMPRVPWMRKDWQKRYEPYIRTENAIRELPSVQLIAFASPDNWDEKPKFYPEDWREIL